jgi:hypothetical protein
MPVGYCTVHRSGRVGKQERAVRDIDKKGHVGGNEREREEAS